MSHVERQEVVASDVQPRKYCPDCHREWVYATYEFGPPANCFACGSPEVIDIKVRGGYDSTTDFDAIGPLLMGVAPEQLAKEADARAQLTFTADVQAPPATLQETILGQDLHLSYVQDAPLVTSQRALSRSFAPEFD